MAGYFSNHSQSRFLPASNTGGAQQQPQQQEGQQQRSRVVPSKHFSTIVQNHTSSNSVANLDAELSKDLGLVESNVNGTLHPLQNTWVFWFRQQRAPGNKIVNYEEGIKKISSCNSVESFWVLWTHLHAPSSLVPTTDYLVFHSAIHRPVWEDPLNTNGGKWIIRLKKGVADRIWEDLVLAVIGDQFDDCQGLSEESSEDEYPQICGCTISVRQHEDIITLWNKTEGDQALKESIRDRMRKVLNLPSSTIMEYKSNNDSMHDKSSFRTSTNSNERRL